MRARLQVYQALLNLSPSRQQCVVGRAGESRTHSGLKTTKPNHRIRYELESRIMSNTLYAVQDPRKQYPGPSFRERASARARHAAGDDAKAGLRRDFLQGEWPLGWTESTADRRRFRDREGLPRFAFAREGADIAIGYLPQEQVDAEEVAQLAIDAGRQAFLIPGDISQEAFSPAARDTGYRTTRWLGHPRQQRRQDGLDRRSSRHVHRAFRRADEDKHLFAFSG